MSWFNIKAWSNSIWAVRWTVYCQSDFSHSDQFNIQIRTVYHLLTLQSWNSLPVDLCLLIRQVLPARILAGWRLFCFVYYVLYCMYYELLCCTCTSGWAFQCIVCGYVDMMWHFWHVCMYQWLHIGLFNANFMQV